MSTTFTANVGLGCPAFDDTGWDAPIRATIGLLDALTPIGALGCSLRENPSTSLYVSFAAGSFRASDGQVVAYGGATVAAPVAVTMYYWLTDAGTLTAGWGWPSGPYVPLSIVAAGASTVISIADARIAFQAVGTTPRAAVTTASATYAIGPAGGLLECNAASAAFTATLPSAVLNPGLTVRVIKVNSSGNAVTLATTSGQTINGASTIGLSSQWAGKTLISDGANWMSF